MQKDILPLERKLKALGNRRRLRILMELKKRRTATVSDLRAALGIALPSTSQHLRILRNAGIVEDSKRGLNVTYRISLSQEEPVRAVLRML